LLVATEFEGNAQSDVMITRNGTSDMTLWSLRSEWSRP